MIPDIELVCKIKHSRGNPTLHTVRPVNRYSVTDGFYAECNYCHALQRIDMSVVELDSKDEWIASEMLQCAVNTQAYVTERILATKIKNDLRVPKEDRTEVKMQDVHTFGSNIDWMTKERSFLM